MAIAFVGDLHGNMKAFQKIVDEINKIPEIKAIIQVGDFGVYPQTLNAIWKLQSSIPIYFIDGNHEDFDLLWAYDVVDGVAKVANNVFYVPRGTVLEIDGRNVAFCGGAASVDKKIRLAYGMPWHDEENLRPGDVEKMAAASLGKKIDIFVTHVPPQSTIQRNFDPKTLVYYFNLPITWKDPNADMIEELWNQMGNPKLICGHMHRSVYDENVRILNINELYCI